MIRCGASKKIIVRSSCARSLYHLLRAPFVLGGKPSKQKRSVGNPESNSAEVTALGPGKTLI